MTSYLLIFSWVVLFTLFGSVVCSPVTRPNTDSTSVESMDIDSSLSMADLHIGESDLNLSSDESTSSSVGSSEFPGCVTEKELLHVTMIRHHRNNEKLEDGLIALTLYKDTWYWYFYESCDWTPHSDGSAKLKPDSFRSSRLPVHLISGTMKRNENSVTFKFKSEADRKNSARNYTLIFANENDAKIFANESDAKILADKSDSKIFSGKTRKR